MESPSSLTKLEIGAVLQLIQLSGGCSYNPDDFEVYLVNFWSRKDGDEEEEEKEDSRSAGDALSSTSIDELSDEALPRLKPKYGSLVDIYRKTQPLISDDRRKKRHKV